MTGHKSIRQHMMRSFSGIVIVLILLLSIGLYFSISRLITLDEIDKTGHNLSQASALVEAYIERLKAMVSMLASNEALHAYLLEEGQASGVESLFATALTTDEHLESITLVSRSGEVITTISKMNISLDQDMMMTAWYQAAVTGDQMPVLTSARMQEFTINQDEWVISMSQELKDDQGKNLGVLLIDVKYDVMATYLDNMMVGQEGFSFITSDEGALVYHKDPRYFSDESLQASLEEFKGQESYQNKIIHEQKIKGSNWTLTGVFSMEQLQAIQRQILEMLFLLSGVLIIMAILISKRISKNITHPLSELMKAMAQVDRDLAEVSLAQPTYKEIEALSSRYNEMISTIKRLMKEIEKKEKYLRTYELKALQSQINPHFLYNTLDTIIWMAEFNQPDKVIKVTKALGDFFRKSLQNENDLVPLAHELDHVKEYLFIQQQRYGDELTYSFAVETEVVEAKVPRFLLQPLVENAIYHGIKEKDGGGHIEIAARIHQGFLELTIRDNGVGLVKVKKEPVKLGGIGISNIRKRIDLLYQGQGSLTITNHPQGGALVTLMIPQVEI